jgi:apolipoprotein N-acyltransferase
LGGLLLWAAQPPLAWSPLAWVAPIPWLLLIRDAQRPGRGGYCWIWVGGCLHWLALLQGIRLPYWALYFGWFALSLYLAVYVPLFIGLCRVAVHVYRWPLLLAAPVGWAAMELARAHVITGFAGAMLGHSQVSWTTLIQIADLGGAYAVGFLVMWVAVCALELFAAARRPRSLAAWSLLAAVPLASCLLYGAWRQQHRPAAQPAAARVALLQGTYDTIFEFNPRRNLDMFRQFLGLAQRAAEEVDALDLIIWPESAFTENNPHWVLAEPSSSDAPSPESREQAELRRRQTERYGAFLDKAATVAELVNGRDAGGRPLRNIQQIVGVETVDVRTTPPRHFNSALWLDAQGRIQGRYDKMHLVMFGEYVPFASRIPLLARTPLGRGVTPGSAPTVFDVAGVRYAPSICFESFVPHLIRGQMVELRNQGRPADVLINVTHDGWFWGSSILDLHLHCSVFRAVENRTPLLMAANPGLTAWIDGDGRIRAALPRHREAYLVAEVVRDPRNSLYQWWGDLPAGLCLACTLGWGLGGMLHRRQRPTGPRVA